MSIWKGILTVIRNKIDVIDGLHDVPAADSALNQYIRDVLGSKLDTLSGDSAMALLKLIEQQVYETEKHFHNFEKWFGAAVTPSGETHIADEMNGVVAPFQLIAGNNDFNASWTQILGSSDLPLLPNTVRADAHRIQVTTTNSTDQFIIQIVTGESSGIAAKLAAKEYSMVPYIASTNNADSGIAEIITPRIVTPGTKVWARCACVGQNGTNINFYIGIHEYLR
jgi:hypothetical protein